jgi:2-hydroxychromene-2-carboxylate isomerase
MVEQQTPTIDYYVWLLSDWAYLGGVRFVQLAARHGLKINHIPVISAAAPAGPRPVQSICIDGQRSNIGRILKGAKPATRFQPIVNLKSAKVIELTIPETFLVRAGEVIE